MNPELEVLDYLSAQDESLILIGKIFGVEHDGLNLDRACHVLTIQIKNDWVELIHKATNGERVLSSWEARQILSDKAHWQTPISQAIYFLRLTEKGAKYYFGQRLP